MTNRTRLANLLCAASAFTLGLAPAFAQQAQSASGPAAGGAGTVTHLSGVLTARKADGATRFLSVNSVVAEGDTVVTTQGTYARMKFADNGEVVLRPGTQIKVDAYKFDQDKPEADNVLISLLKGGMRSVTGLIGKRNREKVVYAAPNATIGIRGTHFGALLCQGDCTQIPTPSGGPPPNGLHVDVMDGAVTISNNAGQQVINAGQFAYVRDAITMPSIVPPQQGIQVTMPVAISRNEGSGGTVGRTRQDNECVVP